MNVFFSKKQFLKMNDNLIRLLNLFKNQFFTLGYDPLLICPHLQLMGHLKPKEVDQIEKLNSHVKQIKVICDILQTRSEQVFVELQKLCAHYQWGTLHNLIHSNLNKDAATRNLLWPPNLVLVGTFNLTVDIKGEIENLKKELCEFYDQDLHYFERCWQRVGLQEDLKLESFFNPHIRIEKQSNSKSAEFFDFMNILKTDYKSIVLLGEMGSGKSTLAHEIVRQWSAGDETIRSAFDIVVLIRLQEINRRSVFEDILSIAFQNKLHGSAQKFIALVENTALPQKRVLFVLDGYDEYVSQDCEALKKLMAKLLWPNAVTLITTRSKNFQLNEVFGERCLLLNLQGFTEAGILSHLEKFHLTDQETSKHVLLRKNIFKVPLFLTAFCCIEKEHKVPNFVVRNGLILFDFMREYVNILYRKHSKVCTFTEKDKEIFVYNFGQILYQETVADKKDESVLQLATEIGFLSPTSKTFPIFLNNFPHDFFKIYFKGEYFALLPITDKKSLIGLDPRDYFSSSIVALSKEEKPENAEIVGLEYLGSGSFSTVYSATYNMLPVAIKQFKFPDNQAASSFYKACLREAKTLKELQHENVLRYVDFISETNSYGQLNIRLVTELIVGGTMRRFCKRDDTDLYHLSRNEKLRISTCCWNGLVYMHSKNVCHKDIKPENILVSKDIDVVKIADFGLAEFKTTFATCTTKGEGTWMYHPPEIAIVERGKRHSQLSDVYSLGATLCELFSEQYFWATDDQQKLEDMAILFKLGNQRLTVESGEKPEEPSCWKNVPDDLKIILLEAIAIDYKKRKSAFDMFTCFRNLC